MWFRLLMCPYLEQTRATRWDSLQVCLGGSATCYLVDTLHSMSGFLSPNSMTFSAWFFLLTIQTNRATTIPSVFISVCIYIYIYTCIDRHTVLVVFCGQRSSCHSLVHLFEQHGTPQPWKHRLSFGDALSHHTFKGTTIRAHGLFQPQPHTRRDCYLWWAWWLQDCIRNWHDQSSATRIEINRLTYIV